MNLIDLNVVIRSVGERTVELTRDSVLRQGISSENIKIIQITPFENALKEMMLISLNSNKALTLALDADVVLSDNSITKLLDYWNNIKSNTFTIQGKLHDKVFGEYRSVGHRLYSTEIFNEAIKHIPKPGEHLRPETALIEMLNNRGIKSVQVNKVFGLHGHEQYFTDVYRTAYVHGKKHTSRKKYVIERCFERFKLDPDFIVILRGFIDGLTSLDTINLDASWYIKKAETALHDLALPEKPEINAENLSDLSRQLQELHKKMLKELPNFPANNFGFALNNFYKYGILKGFTKNLSDWLKI
jgi:hypothetical protein